MITSFYTCDICEKREEQKHTNFIFPKGWIGLNHDGATWTLCSLECCSMFIASIAHKGKEIKDKRAKRGR